MNYTDYNVSPDSCAQDDLDLACVNEEGYLEEWLGDDARCAAQAAFTGAVEARLASQSDGEFLTCRGIFEIIDHIGFRRA